LSTPGFPISPLLFLVPIVGVMALRILRYPRETSIGFIILLLGVPVFGWVLTRRRPAGENIDTPSTS
jgi:ABC-type Fe3+-siderophore transport system permease subunit